MPWARLRLARRLRKLGVPAPPAPYTVDAWCEAIGRRRGTPLEIRDVQLDAEMPPSLLVRAEWADFIMVDAALPTLARTQAVLHEVAHLVLDHSGDVLHDDVEVDTAVEAEAELAADLLYEQMTRAATVGLSGGREAGRMACRSEMWWRDRSADWHVNQLWMTLRAGMPDAKIVSISASEQVPVEVGGRRHRHRRVVEVHDALRQLRPWYSEPVYASAERRAMRYRLDPGSVAAVAEAAAIAVALRRCQANLFRTEETPHTIQSLDLSDVRAETRRLARISRALHDSPLVRAEVARWVPVTVVGDTVSPAAGGEVAVGLPATSSAGRAGSRAGAV